ncbi:hypothetical protein TNCV_1332971 [Trichonephila clavipes]|nr:hypothetical protein TNCV_1332971 [Trichonephila clavipes]
MDPKVRTDFKNELFEKESRYKGMVCIKGMEKKPGFVWKRKKKQFCWRSTDEAVGFLIMQSNKRYKMEQRHQNSDSAIAALRALLYMKGMRDNQGPVTSSALDKMMKKMEATCSFASRQRNERSL